MSTKKITYEKKAPFQTDENIPEINQVTSDNLNEIKDVVNINADELESKQPKEQGKGLSTNDFTNEFKNKLENLNNYDDKEITSKVTNLEENVVNIQKEQTTQNKDIEDLKTDNKKNKTDLQAIKQEQQDQNSKIENNTVENKDNTELLNQIMGLLPSAKGEGEHVTLDNTAEARFKNFEMQGNRKQETRSGKNKFDGNFSQGYDSSGKITGSSQFVCNTNLINVIQNKTYTISNNLNLKIASIAYYKDNEFVNFKSNIASNTINIPENVNQIRFNLYREQGLSVSEINMCQLEEGEIATDYEPYGASPSPEFPSKIRNVGDNVNFFNKDGNTLFEYDVKLAPIENGIKGTLTVAGTSKYCVMKLGGSELLGKTLIVHGNAIFSGKNDGLIGFYFGINNDFVGNWITDSGIISKEHPKIERIFKIPDTFPEGRDTIYILLYANGRSTEAKVGDYVEYRDLKIEEGTQATAYSPYNCGNAEVTVYNKNLYDNKNANVLNSPIDSNGIGTNAGDTYKTIYIPCKPNTTYTVSKLYDVAKNRFALGYTNTEPTYSMQVEGYISNANVSNLTITTGKNAKYLLAYVWITGGTNTYQEMLSSIQIEENAEATNKIENKQQTIVFPFSEGQRLYKGDYLAEDGIHHVRKQIVLDGTEGWQLGGSGNNLINQRFYLANNDIKPNGAILCNYFKEMYRGNIQITVEDIEACNISNGRYIQIKINKKIASTVDEFKNWIKQKKNEGNPITLECEVESEIIEPYTQEQQEAYNKLKKLYSYNEQTNIFSKDEISPVFNVEAIKNLNATFAQLSATMLERS